MIVYLDTSALVKLYVSEAFSTETSTLVARCEATASHAIAYVEARAAFARRLADKTLEEGDYQGVKRDFEGDWANYLQIDTHPILLLRAADLAESFGLRACDSVHLAAAEWLRTESGETVAFACFDQKLNRAANVLGLRLPEWQA
jgi:Predicted nucleic acid-binding protein, contains PIN domain